MFMEKQAEKFRTITAELKVMAKEDQAMRLHAQEKADNWNKNVDYRNTERMKDLVNEIAWPSISKVGKEASSNAWLLVQHADHDQEFQKKCLELMKSEPENDVDKINIAYLEDRVAVAEGRPQIYGTQFYKDSDGKMQPRQILDLENIERRREEMGLESFEEYQKRMRKKYNRKDDL